MALSVALSLIVAGLTASAATGWHEMGEPPAEAAAQPPPEARAA